MIRRMLTLAAALALATTAAQAADKVVMGTNWLAQGGHGGYYQALADGTYAKHGLDVEISMGGPQVNNRPLLAAGRLDFLMAGNLLLSFDNVRNGIPTTVVAAIYQRDPQALMAHKGAYADFAALAKAPKVLISKDGQFSFWPWLVQQKGFHDEQLRPYGFSLAPFLADKELVQQAYGTAEPIYAAAEGADPEVFLLADQGWNTYASTIETRNDLIEKNPDLVQRFIDATIEGWYTFLYGDHSAGYSAIIAANPEMTAEKLDAEMAKFKELGIIDVGDALDKGIGAVDPARVAAFYQLAVSAGILAEGSVDPAKVATDQFVNKGHGLDLKAKLTGQ